MIDDMQVYIANLGKYNEGELVGDWFSFPLDEEVIAERIGLNAEYEEYAIHDTDNFPMEISEYTSIEELNRIYEQLEELPDYLLDDLDSFISCYGSLEELVEHKDDIILYSGCETMTDLAYYLIDEEQVLGEIPSSLQNYIDYTDNFKLMPDGIIRLYDYLNDLETVASALAESHILVTGLSVSGDTLEDYFLSKIGGTKDVKSPKN